MSARVLTQWILSACSVQYMKNVMLLLLLHVVGAVVDYSVQLAECTEYCHTPDVLMFVVFMNINDYRYCYRSAHSWVTS